MIKITPFRDKPLKQKLSAIILLTSSILVLLATMAIATNDLLSYRRNLIAEVFTLADLIGINTGGAIVFEDQKVAEENMAGLHANPHITTAHIFSATDTVFASYFRETGAPGPQTVVPNTLNEIYPQNQTQVGNMPRPDNYLFRNHHLEVFKQIRFKNDHVGLIYIQSDLTALTERLWWTVGILITVLFISLLLGLWIAGKLQQLVTTPIYHLLQIMDTVSTQNDYSLRATKPGNDELGKLVDGFNQMLGQIQDYREHLEDKVKQRTVELAKARDQALAANKAKSVFLANISHEIRTPLNAVLGYAQLLQRDTNLTQEQYDSLQIIETSGDHLLELINDILDMSKIEAGASELRHESFSLCQLIQDVGAMFKGTCEQKQLTWRVDTDIPDADRVVSGDVGKLRQVLINLVGNAVKFTHAGDIVLQVTPSSNDVYQFEVRDTGPGISPDSLENIFKPFYQDTAGIAQGGTGLGLTISKQQVELMGGTLTVTSTLGRGSSFTVSVPLPSSQDQVAGANTIPKHFRLAPQCHVTALVADAQKDQRVMLATMLRQIGVEVYEAVSGPECLEDLQTQPTQIAFLSMQLPLLSTVDVMERLRGEGLSPALPCVAIVHSQPQGQQVLSLGFQEVLLTPFRFETLHQCLTQWVSGIEFEEIVELTVGRGTPTNSQECVPATVTTSPQRRLEEINNLNRSLSPEVLSVPPAPVSSDTLLHIDMMVDLKGAKILMVDDTPENLEVLRKVLIKDQYQVWFANSGEMAIQLASQTLPDLILLDVMMPVMDGFETCQILKQQEATKNIPVVFITAKHQTEDIVEAFANGAVDFVNKPFKQEEVRMRVRNHLQLYLFLKQREHLLRLADHARQLADQARLAAEAANRAKSTFLSNLSHELRTPLNGILGYTQILIRDVTLTHQQLESLKVIQRSGEYLLTLLTDVLDLAKMETGHIKLLETEFHLDKFLQNLVSLFQNRAELKGISFVYQPLSPLPLGVRGDEKRLRQILVNLLGNAVKFTHRGGVTFKVGYPQDVSPGEGPSPKLTIRFQVEDTGIGIAKAELDHILLPFQQGGDPQYRPDGTGVGLTIANNLIELMGGHLQIESTLGQGSHFWFELPLREIPHWVDANEANRKVITGYQGPPRHLLVVDDHWENRAILRDLLKPLGFEVTEAQNGQEGFEKMVEHRPELVITDLVMPVMDGFELIRQLRHSAEFQDLPILVFSASVLEEEIPKTGYHAFLAKPFHVDQLLELLQVHLRLTWNYGTYTPPQASIEQAPVEEKLPEILVGPSPEQAAILADLALMGDIHGVVAEVTKFHQENPQLDAFFQHLESLAKRYEMDQIEDLVRRFL